MRTRLSLLPVLSLAAAAFFAAARAATPPELSGAEWRFSVRYAPTVYRGPYTGRVFLFFTRRRPEPRFGPDWFRPEEFIARNVTNWKAGETLTFLSTDTGILAYPKPFKEIDLTGYRGQAVVRFNPFERQVGDGPGNGYSDVVAVETASGDHGPQLFVVDRLVPPQKFPETSWRKEFIVRSKLLSKFHGRDVSLSAAVVLPAGYEANPTRRYPTIFTVPGFSGTHFPSRADPLLPEPTQKGVDFLRVVLDPSCPLGHHVFADSANNGPVGEALIREFLPAFDRTFRSVGDPRARFLTGHSSGGWSTLWLQVTYPGQFAGTWSTSPDPVDFRDFQRIDLYRRGENLYFDEEGRARPLARFGGRVVLNFPGFAHMEDVLGPGGQLHSFEAVFSPRGSDGLPQLLWDPNTGAIHSETAHAWEKYDIRLVLERNWKTLGPKIAGKIHVFMGSEDTFYLDGATRLLGESLARLGSDAVVEIHRDKNHFTLLDLELIKRIHGEMADAYRKAFPHQALIP
jgi:hypothetical protein